MSRTQSRTSRHHIQRIGWLRAAVLGANDGILSTSSLIVGVAAASPGKTAVLLAGIAGLAAGAMSMAAGEFVSVSSQSDTERADLAAEKRELEENPEAELDQLTQIYVDRGLEHALARQVATQLTERNGLAAHARDELGISESVVPRPVQAALASAASFSIGASVPVAVAVAVPAQIVIACVSASSLASLALLGAISAEAGGASKFNAAVRVTFWGALAMAVTAGIGRLFGTVV
ncbi:MAG: VIT1/CCC1 transporter family protein [Hyphomicrobiaceae bacterium]|nr:VIT1/CCC1 transporter family protein [Hyphomicrobiaceae bacterium]